MNSNQMLAVWGSPGSGATSLSIKIAQKLEVLKRSVMVVLCDDETPSLPILIPTAKQDQHSLGDLLSQSRITQTDILKYSVPYSDNISLIGYRIDENGRTYPKYSQEAARNFLMSLALLADNTIIDCSHHLSSNVLSCAALESADTTLRVVNAGLKSAMYFRSQRQLLANMQCHYDKQLVVMNNVMPGQDENVYSSIFGSISYTIPHTPSIVDQYETGKLSESLFGREAKRFEPVIRQIVKDVFIS